MGTRALDLFQPAVRAWFSGAFPAPTKAQQLGWPAIARGESTLILAPTGSGKTLAAFLWCLNRLMFEAPPPLKERCRVLYVSPLKALAVDVERNLRAPLAGIANAAEAEGVNVTIPQIAIRTGDTPAGERARFLREAADILITTPESLFLLLTSNARERLVHVDTVIIDEIHALVPSKRGAHLALSLERLEALRANGPPEGGHYVPPGVVSGLLAAPKPRSGEGGSRPLQRIGLSATQRPLDEVARFLGGAEPRHTTPKRRPAPKVRQERGKAAERKRVEEVEAQLHDEFATEEKPPTFRPVTILNASEKKQIKLRIEVPVEDMARSADRSVRSDRSAGPVRSECIDLVVDPPAAARIDPRASVDAALRQQPPAGRAAGRCVERAGGRTARAVAPRLAGTRDAQRGRRSPEGRTDPRPRGHLVARARDRHGGDRPGGAD